MGALILDGAIGTELERAGHDTGGPAWSARVVDRAPDALAALHRAYDAAGAEVHTANTFRTTPRAYGAGWEGAARRAIEIARGAVRGRVAASLAPLEDCWHPERSPVDPRAEHAAIAAQLVHAGADLVLCETFAHPGEALAAVDAAVGAGAETWLSLTGGPDGALLEPRALAAAAAGGLARGARRALVNCVHAERIGPYVEALAALGAPFGVYANAGLGEGALSPARYAELASAWVAAGATVVGGCCGTGPAHVRALAARLRTG